MLLVGLGYLGLLFAVATWGDSQPRRRPRGGRPLIYALSLGVYCTSWTYFGSVGIAARTGLDFIPIYLGPILVFVFGWRLIEAIAAISKRHNIASIADFISARYGKSEALGALVAVIAVIGIVPYISIQLKAVSTSLQVINFAPLWQTGLPASASGIDGLSIMVAVTMGIFAILFGTRHIDTTEHQDGMILAIAVESIVKLVAFLLVGFFVVNGIMGGWGSFFARIAAAPQVEGLFSQGLDVAGLLVMPPGSDPDTFVLALPVNAGSQIFTMIAFIGGLSASTAMVIVECIALSIMVCNNLVVPLLLRQRDQERVAIHNDMGERLVLIRRWAIVLVLTLAYGYYRMIGSSAALAQVGLISFAAIAQLAPAFFGGLLWRRGTARGAMAGIAAGSTVWLYTLLLPSFVDAGWIGRGFVDDGPLGLAVLRPRMLFFMEFDPVTHGVLWSMIVNISTYVVVSLMRLPTAIERMQAASFVSREIPGPGAGFRLWRTTVSAERLEATVARYIGPARSRAAFAEYFAQRGGGNVVGQEADIRLFRFAEHLLASAVGVSSARLVIALMLERHSTHARGAMRLLDDASAAIQYNRDVLQSAIDNVGQAIAVFDRDMALICWNSQFQDYLSLSSEMTRVGAPMAEIVPAFLARTDSRQERSVDRLRKLMDTHDLFRERMTDTGKVLEIRSSSMPDGGVVVTFIDVTESVEAADALQRANESLERRVAERTAELTRLNKALAVAKSEADAANTSKTQFLAAASHDILQPLNAARLFAASLVERTRRTEESDLARNVDASLEAVEDILSALLDISRLDAGAMKPDVAPFRIDEMVQALALEFTPAAARKNLRLKVMPCGLTVETDRKLLRRVLQNLVANAIKYTRQGEVLMGCRRRGSKLRIEVHDTGPGIPADKRDVIFQEFQRLHGDDEQTGLGLGLSIVERIARVLNAPVTVRSTLERGSCFAIEVPVAAVGLPRLPAAKPQPLRTPGLPNAVTVLVIDNEKAILDGMETLLTGWGFIVHRARSQAEAVKALQAVGGKLDMILADYHLVREDGISVVRALRKRARKHIPAVLITADRSPAVADSAVAHDIHILRKPVKPAALRAAMAHVAVRTEAAE
ncbi:MAG: PAS domain-containing hybrid sensor histidine kinase/response regulator [Alphaproteobacteria bacterium]|nr:PAS domain-containing hybrid sensor histidine kinase/response regulator [Alphaproteobacteria bacterium]